MKSRSPNYPTMSLKEAADKIKQAYSKAGRHKTERLAMANVLGYKSLSGKSLSVLGALSAYGMLEKTKGQISITEDGEAIAIYPESSKERLEALETCLRTPAVFSELLDDHNGELPSNDLLRPYLIKKKFSSAAANTAISSIRESIQFLKEESSFLDDNNISLDNKEIDINDYKIEDSKPDYEVAKELKLDKIEGMKQDIFSLDEGQASIQWPTTLSQESFEDFETWLNLVLRKAKRSIEEPKEDE